MQSLLLYVLRLKSKSWTFVICTILFLGMCSIVHAQSKENKKDYLEDSNNSEWSSDDNSDQSLFPFEIDFIFHTSDSFNSTELLLEQTAQQFGIENTDQQLVKSKLYLLYLRFKIG